MSNKKLDRWAAGVIIDYNYPSEYWQDCQEDMR